MANLSIHSLRTQATLPQVSGTQDLAIDNIAQGQAVPAIGGGVWMTPDSLSTAAAVAAVVLAPMWWLVVVGLRSASSIVAPLIVPGWPLLPSLLSTDAAFPGPLSLAHGWEITPNSLTTGSALTADLTLTLPSTGGLGLTITGQPALSAAITGADHG